MESEPQTGAADERQEAGETETGSELDYQALAEQVYRLLKEELRLEAERRGW